MKKMKEDFDKLVSQEKAENDVTVLAYTHQVPELMSISDLVVTKPGGLTSTESLASGLPMVLLILFQARRRKCGIFRTSRSSSMAKKQR